MTLVFSFFFILSSEQDAGLTKIDFELARLRGLLEKKYANDHDAGYTYINSVNAESTPLTPFMLKEWARAMVREHLDFSGTDVDFTTTV